MTHSRREELRKILPKKKIIHRADWEKEPKFNANRSGYNKAIDDCLSTLENKVILRSELLSVEEIEEIIEDKLKNITHFSFIDFKGREIDCARKGGIERERFVYDLAQQIHDRQEGR